MDKSELDVALGTIDRDGFPHARPDRTWLLANGWKRRVTRSGSTNEIFISPCKKFVCKNGYFISTMPACAIPTKFLEQRSYNSYAYVLQPLADLRRKKGLTEKIRSMVGRMAYHDIHIGNVAWYLGNPVMIDW